MHWVRVEDKGYIAALENPSYIFKQFLFHFSSFGGLFCFFFFLLTHHILRVGHYMFFLVLPSKPSMSRTGGLVLPWIGRFGWADVAAMCGSPSLFCLPPTWLTAQGCCGAATSVSADGKAFYLLLHFRSVFPLL